MAATTTTTIRGVSLLTKQGRRSSHSFDLALSPDGIEIRRAGRPARLMSWARVSQWDIQERKGYVVLTLRGEGAATPLTVPGWTPDDLEILLRDLTAGSTGAAPPTLPAVDVAPTPAPAVKPAPPTGAPDAVPAEDPSGSERPRQHNDGKPWKTVVTVVLLGLLATSVTLVLLQSAGIISWGFLGPTA
ncbi:MAG TPA: hypothetical protein VN820_04725 [Acidimicrobiales bacterium]|nr:hypothetical protein [Acidimicrobiales bacterium]